mgnify:CR=1 FL=1
MLLKCAGTGSKGNSYALIADNGEVLMIECGVKWSEIMKMIDYQTSKAVGCICSHAHSDHLVSYKDCLHYGIPIYTNDETAEHFEIISGEKMIGKPERIPFEMGSFHVTGFYLPHTTRDKDTGALIPCPNFGYLIQCGDEKLLYMTDWEYCSYVFKKQRINYMVLECNHMDNLMDSSSANYIHALKGHSSLSVVKDFVEVNKTPDLRNIILCHLSSENADPETMQKEVQSVAGKWVNVAVAKKDMIIPLNRYPF